jgi:hypothetical protein
MGDRATIQLVRGEDFSPLIYVHWAGYRTLDIIRAAAPHLRGGDLDYAFARLTGHFHNQTGGDGEALSLGVSNADRAVGEDLTGDAGHFRVDLATGTVRNWRHGHDGTVVADGLTFFQG